MRIISSCIVRGLICSASNILAQYDTENINNEKIARSFIYGFATYPILLHTYSRTKLFFYIQPKTSYAILTSTIYEMIVYPVTSLPLYYFIMFKDKNIAWKKYKEDVYSIVLYSSCFWVPFTLFQTRYVSLNSFGPVRLSASFLYNIALQLYTSSSTS